MCLIWVCLCLLFVLRVFVFALDLLSLFGYVLDLLMWVAYYGFNLGMFTFCCLFVRFGLTEIWVFVEWFGLCVFLSCLFGLL